MIEPFFLRARSVARALFRPGRPHAREPYMTSRSQEPDRQGEPGCAPLGADDEAGGPPARDDGSAPLDGRKGPPG